MGLHYLTFMRRNAENKKKLMPVWRMNSGGLSNKDIVHNVGIFDDSTSINNKYMEIMLRWRVIHVLVKGIRLHPIFEVQLEYTNSKRILLVYSRNPQNIFQGHGTDPHDWIMLCGSSICSNSKMQSCNIHAESKKEGRGGGGRSFNRFVRVPCGKISRTNIFTLESRGSSNTPPAHVMGCESNSVACVAMTIILGTRIASTWAGRALCYQLQRGVPVSKISAVVV